MVWGLLTGGAVDTPGQNKLSQRPLVWLPTGLTNMNLVSQCLELFRIVRALVAEKGDCLLRGMVGVWSCSASSCSVYRNLGQLKISFSQTDTP